MLNPYTILAAIAMAVTLFGGGLTIGIKWEQGRAAVEDQHVQKAVDAALQVSADAIAKIKVTNKTIQGETRHEIETHTVYSDCRLTPVGLQLAAQALDGAKPAGDLKLPRLDAPGK